MADKTTKNLGEESFHNLLLTLRRAATETSAVDGAVEGAPGNADSLEQADLAGSQVDVEGGDAEHPDNGVSPEIKEPGEDKGGVPTVKPAPETEEEGAVTAAGPDLLKAAESLEARAAWVLKEACSEIAAEIVLRKRAEAVAETADGLVQELGLTEEEAVAISEGLASGDITEEQLVAALDQTDAVAAIAEQLDADPAQVLALAEQVGAEAEAEGKTVEEAIGEAVAMHQAAAEEQLYKKAHAEYKQLDVVLRKAKAEGDTFTVRAAKRRQAQLLDLVVGKRAEGEDDTIDPDAVAAAAEQDAATAAPDGTDGSGGEEQLAAGMLAEGVPADEVEAAQQAIQDLVDSGIPPEVIEEMVANEMAGGVPEAVMHEASAEKMAEDPLLAAHVYFRAALEEHRRTRGK